MTLLKYKDHLSMDIIRTECETENTFTFPELNTEKTEKGFRPLNSNKGLRYFDILNEAIKETTGSFSNLLCTARNGFERNFVPSIS